MNRSRQQGFSLVTAIFLLVVIGMLGTFAVTLSTTQHQSAALDVMGSRAYQAARAGVEWAAYHVASSPVNAPAAWTGCAQNTPLGSLGGTLSPFTVTVNCNAASHPEGTDAAGATNYIWIYDVSAVAITGGSPGDPGYVERVISVKMGK
jgi:MSHA biogenesis protein MshP